MIATGGRISLGWFLGGALGLVVAISADEAASQQSDASTGAERSAGAAKRARTSKSRNSADKSANPKASAKLDAAAAQSEVEAGVNAITAGKPAQAVAHFDAALGAGSLPSSQTARALYYRGVAHRKTGKTASAISDLTSALWLKGLTPQQRADALDNRAAAYREAGLSDQTVGAAVREPAASPVVPPRTRSADAGPPGVSNAGAPYTIVKYPPAQQSTPSTGGIFGSLVGSGSPAPAPSAAPAATRPSPPTTTASVAPVQSVPYGFEGAEVFGAAAAPAVKVRTPTPAARPATSSSWNTTSSLRTPAPASVEAKAAPRTAPVVARSWSKATKVKSVRRRPAHASQPAAAAPPQKARPVTSGPPSPAATAAVRSAASARSSYQVQVAAVRSAQEAAGVAAQVQQRFARDLGGRAPVVDQTVVGNIGTIYRVQIGPFASSGETQALCSKLKGAGMDCRIVAAAQ